MLVGAYTYAVLTIPMAKRAAVYQYYNGGIIGFTVPTIVGILAAGALAALIAALTFYLGSSGYYRSVGFESSGMSDRCI